LQEAPALLSAATPGLASQGITLESSFTGISTQPRGALTAAGGGLYYGTTYFGGANSLGGAFVFNSSTGLIALKDSFTGTNGKSPVAALTPAGGGLYYGTTNSGGANHAGAIYSFQADSPGPSASVPAPLPLMGAGASLSWSRRLRRRVRQVQPITPVQD
jgi:hypothetical protein